MYDYDIFSSLKSSKLIIGLTKAFLLGKDISFSDHIHSTDDIKSGVLTLTNGGTGVTSLSALKSLLGINSGTSTVKLAYGSIDISTYDNGDVITVSMPFTPNICIYDPGWDGIRIKLGSLSFKKTDIMMQTLIYCGLRS